MVILADRLNAVEVTTSDKTAITTTQKTVGDAAKGVMDPEKAE